LLDAELNGLREGSLLSGECGLVRRELASMDAPCVETGQPSEMQLECLLNDWRACGFKLQCDRAASQWLWLETPMERQFVETPTPLRYVPSSFFRFLDIMRLGDHERHTCTYVYISLP